MPQNIKQYKHPLRNTRVPPAATVSSKLPNINYALALHQQGQLHQAKAIYIQLLQIEPRNEDALHLLGVMAHQTGAYQEALKLITDAIEINPEVALYYSSLGNALKEIRQFSDALASYDKSISLNSGYAEVYSSRGVLLKELGELNASIDSHNKAIALKPASAEFHSNQGLTFIGLKQLDSAVASFDMAVALKPDYAEAYSNRGLALQELKQFDEAFANYDKAIALKPDLAEAYSNRANALLALRDLNLTVVGSEEAITPKSLYCKTYIARGHALNESEMLCEAISIYDKAIALKPELAEAHSNRGFALIGLKKFNSALTSIDRAINLKPDYAEAFCNKGFALQELEQLDGAVANYDKAIELKPDYVQANWNKSSLLLSIGEFHQGFNLYEWRWRKDECLKLKRDFQQPLWLGEESLSSKTVLLHAEQGLGDTIQFCRYVKMVADLGAKVILEVQKPLKRLLKDLPGVATLISKGDPVPEFDFHCPLLSLPLAFKTELQTIPAVNGYIKAEPERVALWADRLKRDELKIGISWQGSQGTKVDIGRSFELKLFENIAALPNVKLISLQKGYGSEQLRNMPQGMQVLDFEDELDTDGAFLDSAAVMMNLDLVITSDTALAHLAGTLGVKTWIALKYVPDWRWMLERKDSPWYPSMTLYRQQRIDDWQPVFTQIELDITSILNGAT